MFPKFKGVHLHLIIFLYASFFSVLNQYFVHDSLSFQTPLEYLEPINFFLDLLVEVTAFSSYEGQEEQFNEQVAMNKIRKFTKP